MPPKRAPRKRGTSIPRGRGRARKSARLAVTVGTKIEDTNTDTATSSKGKSNLNCASTPRHTRSRDIKNLGINKSPESKAENEIVEGKNSADDLEDITSGNEFDSDDEFKDIAQNISSPSKGKSICSALEDISDCSINGSDLEFEDISSAGSENDFDFSSPKTLKIKPVIPPKKVLKSDLKDDIKLESLDKPEKQNIDNVEMIMDVKIEENVLKSNNTPDNTTIEGNSIENTSDEKLQLENSIEKVEIIPDVAKAEVDKEGNETESGASKIKPTESVDEGNVVNKIGEVLNDTDPEEKKASNSDHKGDEGNDVEILNENDVEILDEDANEDNINEENTAANDGNSVDDVQNVAVACDGESAGKKEDIILEEDEEDVALAEDAEDAPLAEDKNVALADDAALVDDNAALVGDDDAALVDDDDGAALVNDDAALVDDAALEDDDDAALEDDDDVALEDDDDVALEDDDAALEDDDDAALVDDDDSALVDDDDSALVDDDDDAALVDDDDAALVDDDDAALVDDDDAALVDDDDAALVDDDDAALVDDDDDDAAAIVDDDDDAALVDDDHDAALVDDDHDAALLADDDDDDDAALVDDDDDDAALVDDDDDDVGDKDAAVLAEDDTGADNTVLENAASVTACEDVAEKSFQIESGETVKDTKKEDVVQVENVIVEEVEGEPMKDVEGNKKLVDLECEENIVDDTLGTFYEYVKKGDSEIPNSHILLEDNEIVDKNEGVKEAKTSKGSISSEQIDKRKIKTQDNNDIAVKDSITNMEKSVIDVEENVVTEIEAIKPNYENCEFREEKGSNTVLKEAKISASKKESPEIVVGEASSTDKTSAEKEFNMKTEGETSSDSKKTSLDETVLEKKLVVSCKHGLKKKIIPSNSNVKKTGGSTSVVENEAVKSEISTPKQTTSTKESCKVQKNEIKTAQSPATKGKINYAINTKKETGGTKGKVVKCEQTKDEKNTGNLQKGMAQIPKKLSEEDTAFALKHNVILKDAFVKLEQVAVTANMKGNLEIDEASPKTVEAKELEQIDLSDGWKIMDEAVGDIVNDNKDSEKNKKFIFHKPFIRGIQLGKPAVIEVGLFKDFKGPLIGLDYMVEVWKEDGRTPPRYFCSICKTILDVEKLLNHLYGNRHKLEFMRVTSLDCWLQFPSVTFASWPKEYLKALDELCTSVAKPINDPTRLMLITSHHWYTLRLRDVNESVRRMRHPSLSLKTFSSIFEKLAKVETIGDLRQKRLSESSKDKPSTDSKKKIVTEVKTGDSKKPIDPKGKPLVKSSPSDKKETMSKVNKPSINASPTKPSMTVTKKNCASENKQAGISKLKAADTKSTKIDTKKGMEKSDDKTNTDLKRKKLLAKSISTTTATKKKSPIRRNSSQSKNTDTRSSRSPQRSRSPRRRSPFSQRKNSPRPLRKISPRRSPLRSRLSPRRSPLKSRYSPRRSPLRSRLSPRRSPLRSRLSPRRSPLRSRLSPRRSPLRSRLSPRRSPLRSRLSPRRSPLRSRLSPRRSPLRSRLSPRRSPLRSRLSPRRSPLRSRLSPRRSPLRSRLSPRRSPLRSRLSPRRSPLRSRLSPRRSPLRSRLSPRRSPLRSRLSPRRSPVRRSSRSRSPQRRISPRRSPLRTRARSRSPLSSGIGTSRYNEIRKSPLRMSVSPRYRDKSPRNRGSRSPDRNLFNPSLPLPYTRQGNVVVVDEDLITGTKNSIPQILAQNISQNQDYAARFNLFNAQGQIDLHSVKPVFNFPSTATGSNDDLFQRGGIFASSTKRKVPSAFDNDLSLKRGRLDPYQPEIQGSNVRKVLIPSEKKSENFWESWHKSHDEEQELLMENRTLQSDIWSKQDTWQGNDAADKRGMDYARDLLDRADNISVTVFNKSQKSDNLIPVSQNDDYRDTNPPKPTADDIWRQQVELATSSRSNVSSQPRAASGLDWIQNNAFKEKQALQQALISGTLSKKESFSNISASQMPSAPQNISNLAFGTTNAPSVSVSGFNDPEPLNIGGWSNISAARSAFEGNLGQIPISGISGSSVSSWQNPERPGLSSGLTSAMSRETSNPGQSSSRFGIVKTGTSSSVHPLAATAALSGNCGLEITGGSTHSSNDSSATQLENRSSRWNTSDNSNQLSRNIGAGNNRGNNSKNFAQDTWRSGNISTSGGVPTQQSQVWQKQQDANSIQQMPAKPNEDLNVVAQKLNSTLTRILNNYKPTGGLFSNTPGLQQHQDPGMFRPGPIGDKFSLAQNIASALTGMGMANVSQNELIAILQHLGLLGGGGQGMMPSGKNRVMDDLRATVSRFERTFQYHRF